MATWHCPRCDRSVTPPFDTKPVRGCTAGGLCQFNLAEGIEIAPDPASQRLRPRNQAEALLTVCRSNRCGLYDATDDRCLDRTIGRAPGGEVLSNGGRSVACICADLDSACLQPGIWPAPSVDGK